MALAELTAPSAFLTGSDLRGKLGFLAFSFSLAAFTLCTLDGGAIAPLIISAILLFATAIYLTAPGTRPLRITLPAVCLSVMALYAAAQTLWSPSKILYAGWTGVLFWSTAAAILWFGTQLFTQARLARAFRLFLAVFASLVALLELLEQASGTSRYYWFVPSSYNSVFGPFAYWNNFAQFIEISCPSRCGWGSDTASPSSGTVAQRPSACSGRRFRFSRWSSAGRHRALSGHSSRLPRHRNRSLLFAATLAIVACGDLHLCGRDRPAHRKARTK